MAQGSNEDTAREGHKAVVKILLEKGAKLEAKENVDGRRPLYLRAY